MIAHTIELRLTAQQETYFRQCAGTMRFAYNQLVSLLRGGERYNRKAFQKACVTLRQSTPWMQEITSRATYEAADNFDRAMRNFFASCKGVRKGRKIKQPDFKKRGINDSFRFSHSSQFKVEQRHLRIAGLNEQVWMRERIRFIGAVKSVTIKQRAGKWFAVFLIDANLEARPREGVQEPRIGVDLGLINFAVLSTGERIANPRPLRSKGRLLARRQQQLSRSTKGSNRRAIVRQRVARIHKKVSDMRSAFHHRVANRLVGIADSVVIEDLCVSGMVRNRKLAKSISDAGFAQFRAILTYKCKANGVELVVADRFFPSSKTDHKTGAYLPGLTLSDREVKHADGTVTDRDLNAAINLLNYSSPPIRGRRKTCGRGILDPTVGIAVDDANTNPQQGTPHNAEKQIAAVY